MDDTETDDGINTMVDFRHSFTLVRVLGNTIVPARLKMRAEVVPTQEAQEIDFNVTFIKTKFWLDNIVAKSVAFSHENPLGWSMMLDADKKLRFTNSLMITPYEPTDDHLAVLLQAKMTAFAGGRLEFGCVRVEAEGEGVVYTYVGEWETDLPTMDKWLPAKPYYFEVPWWMRDDASNLDVAPPEGTDMTVPPPWAFSLDFIEQAIRPRRAAEEPVEPVVIKGGFRPKVIDGGIGKN